MLFKRKTKTESKEMQIDKAFTEYVNNKENIKSLINDSNIYNFIEYYTTHTTAKKDVVYEIQIQVEDKQTFKKALIGLGKFGITSFNMPSMGISCETETESLSKQPKKLLSIYERFVKGITLANGKLYSEQMLQDLNQKIEESRKNIESTKKSIQWLTFQSRSNNSTISQSDLKDLLLREQNKYHQAEQNLSVYLKLRGAFIENNHSVQSGK